MNSRSMRSGPVRRARSTRAWTSTIWFCRALVVRNISPVPPWKGATSARSLKMKRPTGRANRAKAMPLTTAKPTRPVTDSTATTTLAAWVAGLTTP